MLEILLFKFRERDVHSS